VATIAPGETHFWEYSYSPGGRDVGIAYAAPNIQEPNVDVPLIVVQQSVVARNFDDSTGLVYGVAIRNEGRPPIGYNLNIEDWQ
jgi:hypothetical protein